MNKTLQTLYSMGYTLSVGYRLDIQDGILLRTKFGAPVAHIFYHGPSGTTILYHYDNGTKMVCASIQDAVVQFCQTSKPVSDIRFLCTAPTGK